jgi:hypothetical protein
MLNSHTIIAKWLKNIFQPADPTILSETLQIPALSRAHLRDGLNLISQWLILRFGKKWKNIFQPVDPTIIPETPQIPALSGAHLRDDLNLISGRFIEDFFSSIAMFGWHADDKLKTDLKSAITVPYETLYEKTVKRVVDLSTRVIKYTSVIIASRSALCCKWECKSRSA